jgi:small-conductance mechanosensitive channel/CRP-like cAMP-binding protein
MTGLDCPLPMMDRYIDLLTDTSFAFGGVGVVVVAVMVLFLALLMPRDLRGKVRLPALLLLAHICLYLIHRATKHQNFKRPLEVLGLFVLLLSFGRSALLLVFEWFFRHRLKRPVSRIVRDIAKVFVYFGIAIIVLREMGAELGSLLTTSAVLTAIVGLSLQETLGNLFAGLAIQAQRPFEVGDWIQMAGEEQGCTGRVIEINWRATKLITNDRVEIVIPNGLLAKSPMRNFTQPSPISRRTVLVQCPYDVAPHLAESALLQAAVGCADVLEEPSPFTWLTQYADSGIEYALLYFISDFEQRNTIDADVRRRIWYGLQRAGISIPFPIRDVRLQQSSDAAVQALEHDQSRQRLRLLKSVDFLDDLPESAREQLARSSRLRLYGRGEDIIRQGDEGSELFIIKSGEAIVLVRQERNDPVELARLGAGAVFGEMSLVTGERRNATIRGSTVCEVLVIGHEQFAPVLEQNPDFAQRISDALAHRKAELKQAHMAGKSSDTEQDSGELLTRIRRFFSL